MMLRRVILMVFLIVLVHKSVSPQTDVYLSTERVGRIRIPIVIKEIESESRTAGQSARYITRVLKQDLDFTGNFESLEFNPGLDTLEAGRTAAAMFEGSLSEDGEKYTLNAKLLDFSSREIIFSKKYSFKSAARRTVAHRICDEITYFLIGERSIATTRILFCREEDGVKNLYIIDYDGYGEKRLVGGELIISPTWLDEKRFCYTSYRRGNPDCYLVDLRRGKKTLISHRKGQNVAGDYFADRDEIVTTLSLKGNSEIYLIDSSGKIVRRLTRNRAIDCSPTWAQNGNEIAFVSDRTGVPQIYVMDRFGGNVRRLSREGSYNTSPTWSPDGGVITYVSRQDGLYRLKLISPDGLMENTLFEDYLSYEDPDWAPNGRHIAATVHYGRTKWIVIIDAETGEKRRLVRGEMPAWSPLAPASPGNF